MDSHLNYRHAQDHSAELHRRAELRRLATAARPERKTKARRQSAFRVPGPVPGMARMIGRVMAAVRAAF